MDEIKTLYRRRRNLPTYLKSNGEISSALFLDSKGVSVDIDGNREIDEIITDEERLHLLYNADRQDTLLEYKLKAIHSVSKENCDEKEVYIESAPIEGENRYHALLKRSEDVIILTPSQRKYLARNAKTIKEY